MPYMKDTFNMKLHLFLDLLQQERLFPHLAATFAIKVLSDCLFKTCGEFVTKFVMGDKSDEMVRTQE
jgi:hypothetical protein